MFIHLKTCMRLSCAFALSSAYWQAYGPVAGAYRSNNTFSSFFKCFRIIRPHQGCRLIESTDYGRMNPKLARFCAKVIDKAIIASQSLNKFFSPRIPILSFSSFCSQKTLTSNFFPLYISGALIAHNNQYFFSVV